MIMIPLPFFITAVALIIFYREWVSTEPFRRNVWLLCFLAVLALQEAIIGVRFGYGQDWLGRIQPITAAILPPLAYMSFKRPVIGVHSMLHALPLVIALLLMAVRLELLDAFLAVNNLFYAAALAILALGGNDALSWVEFSRLRLIKILLWLVCGVLIASGMTDAFISYDIWSTSGSNTGNIVSWGSIIAIMTTILVVALLTFNGHRRKTHPTSSDSEAEKAIFLRLEIMLHEERLFVDPDINLNRIARRMVLPVRDVSRAINGQTGQNVSQYINKLRIEEACRLLSETDLQITQIVFASGFNTKSNFNREFARVTHKTPSEWRTNRP